MRKDHMIAIAVIGAVGFMYWKSRGAAPVVRNASDPVPSLAPTTSAGVKQQAVSTGIAQAQAFTAPILKAVSLNLAELLGPSKNVDSGPTKTEVARAANGATSSQYVF